MSRCSRSWDAGLRPPGVSAIVEPSTGAQVAEGQRARRAADLRRQAPGFAREVKAYLHDLTAWNALSAKEQELVVGRTKLADIELGDDVKPSNSHLAVNTIVDETRAQLPIVLDNMPFGHVGAEEVGTHFIGYAATPAVTGSLFFPPAADFLDNLPPRPSVATSDMQSVDNRSGARV